MLYSVFLIFGLRIQIGLPHGIRCLFLRPLVILGVLVETVPGIVHIGLL